MEPRVSYDKRIDFSQLVAISRKLMTEKWEHVLQKQLSFLIPNSPRMMTQDYVTNVLLLQKALLKYNCESKLKYTMRLCYNKELIKYLLWFGHECAVAGYKIQNEYDYYPNKCLEQYRQQKFYKKHVYIYKKKKRHNAIQASWPIHKERV